MVTLASVLEVTGSDLQHQARARLTVDVRADVARRRSQGVGDHFSR